MLPSLLKQRAATASQQQHAFRIYIRAKEKHRYNKVTGTCNSLAFIIFMLPIGYKSIEHNGHYIDALSMSLVLLLHNFYFLFFIFYRTITT